MYWYKKKPKEYRGISKKNSYKKSQNHGLLLCMYLVPSLNDCHVKKEVCYSRLLGSDSSRSSEHDWWSRLELSSNGGRGMNWSVNWTEQHFQCEDECLCVITVRKFLGMIFKNSKSEFKIHKPPTSDVNDNWRKVDSCKLQRIIH